MDLISVLKKHNIKIPSVFYRDPDANDKPEWFKHIVNEKECEFSQPITFTPYASVKPCSARCKFCSENLREANSVVHASQLRPGKNYFKLLDKALLQLQGLPLSYSLSGLEMTDDFIWFATLLDKLDGFRRISPIKSSVLYTNAAGFSCELAGEKFIKAVEDFRFDWLEVSRHHFDDAINQKIMRFRTGCKIKENSVFSSVINMLKAFASIKLVCIVQEDGISNGDELLSYLKWAKKIGVTKVIFREFSHLNSSYSNNNTYSYITSSRVSIVALFDDFLASLGAGNASRWDLLTEGYYFKNIVGQYDDMELIFEVSDYSRMRKKHDSEKIYKLIFHSNGNLCADWDPFKNIIYQAH